MLSDSGRSVEVPLHPLLLMVLWPGASCSTSVSFSFLSSKMKKVKLTGFYWKWNELCVPCSREPATYSPHKYDYYDCCCCCFLWWHSTNVVEDTTMPVVCWDPIPSHVSSQWFGFLECRESVWTGIAMDSSHLKAFVLWWSRDSAEIKEGWVFQALMFTVGSFWATCAEHSRQLFPWGFSAQFGGTVWRIGALCYCWISVAACFVGIF